MSRLISCESNHTNDSDVTFLARAPVTPVRESPMSVACGFCRKFSRVCLVRAGLKNDRSIQEHLFIELLTAPQLPQVLPPLTPAPHFGQDG